MLFTTKAEYGVRLLVQLGLRQDDRPISLKAIADQERLPLAYLERIAAHLKRAGFIESTRGAHGGYELSQPTEKITMDAVVIALEGSITPMECFDAESEGRVLCSHEGDGHRCAAKLMWARVQQGVMTSLHRTTLRELVEFAAGVTPIGPGAQSNGVAVNDALIQIQTEPSTLKYSNGR